jgi:predicted NBD/HSP70 family sugar kinase
MAVARAELHLGNIFLFAERDYGRASARYDDAIRYGVGTQIEASVIVDPAVISERRLDRSSALQLHRR